MYFTNRRNQFILWSMWRLRTWCISNFNQMKPISKYIKYIKCTQPRMITIYPASSLPHHLGFWGAPNCTATDYHPSAKACASHSKSFSRKSASRPPTAGTSWKNVVMGAQAQGDPALGLVLEISSQFLRHFVIGWSAFQRYSKPKRLNPSSS